MIRWFTISLCLSSAMLLAVSTAPGEQDESTGRDIPAALAPLEYLVGGWHGNAIPKNNSAQQFRGWPETHAWAWIFKGGKPVGLSIAFTGDKTFASGRLTHDAAHSLYQLEAKTAGKTPKIVALEGQFDARSKILTLETKDGDRALADKLRISIRPNGSFIRYTLLEERRSEGETIFHKAVETSLTRDGERLAGAGGGDGADRPKCIVTGGAATMTVSFKGATYPLCCTGCRDEFNDNPEKYIKKAALLAAAQAGKPKTAAPAKVGRFDDDFSDDVDKTPKATTKKAMSPAKTATKTASEPNAPAVKKAPAAKDAQATRAASLLKLGQTLEKNGNSKAALGYYKRVLKEYPDSSAAKTAAPRVKALESD